MKTKKRFFHRLTIKKGQIIILILFIIGILDIFFFIQFNRKVTPKLLNVAKASISKLNETILTNFKVKSIYPQVDLENAIVLTKNANDEIISVDFRLENAYKALSIITEYLQKNLLDSEIQKQVLNYYNQDISTQLGNIILTIPMGVASDSLYLNNLGPRIPVRISYMGYISSNIRLKVEDYGINNALISIYIDCAITNQFIVPSIEQEMKYNYCILVASKIIQGIVPKYYGGTIEAKSNLLNVPIP